MRIRNALIASTVVCLAGCGYRAVFDRAAYRALLDRVAPKAEVEFAKERLHELRAGRLEELQTHLDPDAFEPAWRSSLYMAYRYFPTGEPRSLELIGCNVGTGPGWWMANLSFQYEFEDAWMVASVVLRRKDGGDLVVRGLHVQRVPDALERINAFTFEGKGVRQYAFLAGAALLVSLTVAAFIVCLGTRNLRRKWLWAVFTLVGAGGLTINWTTGQVLFQLVTVRLVGAGVVRASPYSPWLLTLSFPLGAVLFFLKRARMRAAPSGETPPNGECAAPPPSDMPAPPPAGGPGPCVH